MASDNEMIGRQPTIAASTLKVINGENAGWYKNVVAYGMRIINTYVAIRKRLRSFVTFKTAAAARRADMALWFSRMYQCRA